MDVFEILAAAVALLPGLYLWWRGRRLIRRIDDPVFPDLYLRRWSHLGAALGVSWALIFVALQSERPGIWIFLSVVGVVASAFPLRKRVFGESWGLLRYLGFVVRLIFLMAGSLVLLALLPALAAAAGADLAPAVAIATGIAVVLWSVFQVRMNLFLVAGRPLVDEELKASLTPVMEKASCPPPRVYRFGFRGGFFVNAFALPARGWGAVAMSDDLLEALEPREAAAIFAHEIAHLEHYTSKRVLRGRFIVMVLTALIVGLVLGLGPERGVMNVLTVLWPVVCMAVFARAVMENRKHEGPSDLRALELTGDAEALISALVKIHAAMRLPRSWEPSLEAQMSHPSLAARLRAIRHAAALEPEEVSTLVVRAEGDPSRAAVLDADRLDWLDGLEAEADGDREALRAAARGVRTIVYEDLRDLRVVAGRSSSHRLRAVDAAGAVLEMPLDAAAAAAVQEALTKVDAKFSPPPKAAVSALGSSVLVRLLALVSLPVALLPPFSGAFAFAALAVALRPGLAAATAAGTAALAGLPLAVYRTSPFELGFPPVFAVLQGVVGLLFLLDAWLLHRRAASEPARGLGLVLGALGAAGLSSIVFAAVRMRSAFPMTSLHLWARGGPALAAAAFAAAAVLAVARSGRRAYLASAVLALFGLGTLVLGTAAFRDRFGDDPLRSTEPRLEQAQGQLEAVRERTFESSVDRIEISPTGRRLAVGVSHWKHGEEEILFRIEKADGELLELPGNDLELLSDDSAAIVVRDTRSLKLRTVHLDSGETLAEVELPDLEDVGLSRAADGTWRVTGSLYEYGEGVAVRLSGDTSILAEERFRKTSDDAFYVYDVLFNTTNTPLGVAERFGDDNPGRELVRLVQGDVAPSPWARTSLEIQCFEPFAHQGDYACATKNGERTQLWAVDPGRESARPLGSVRGWFTQGQVASGQFLLWRYATLPVLAEPRLGRVVEFTDALRGAERRSGRSELVDRLLKGYAVFGIEAVAFRPPFLAVSVAGKGGSTVTLYRLADPLVPEAGKR